MSLLLFNYLTERPGLWTMDASS